MRTPASELPCPYVAPLSIIDETKFAWLALFNVKLRKPGPAISTADIRGVVPMSL